MNSSRNLLIAGVVLLAVALGSTGHSVWWLFGLLWMLPHAGRHGCGWTSRRRDHDVAQGTPSPASTLPDPTQDRHEAFPTR